MFEPIVRTMNLTGLGGSDSAGDAVHAILTSFIIDLIEKTCN